MFLRTWDARKKMMLNYHVSYQILRLGGLIPYSMDPHGFLTTHRFFNDLINGGVSRFHANLCVFFTNNWRVYSSINVGPPSDVSWFVNTSKYSYLRTINPSDIGVMWPLT